MRTRCEQRTETFGAVRAEDKNFLPATSLLYTKDEHWTGLEPVSSEISDFTPCTHAQSNILHTKYADKTDY